jgi:glycerol uptake facilitator-like aquaporin
MKRAHLAEFLGALLLAAAVIGSGIMAERLSGGNAAIALIGNTLATVAVLAVLIAMLGPVSGGHFNPVVTLVGFLRDRTEPARVTCYLLAQVAGCCAGAMLANIMFELPLVAAGTQVRTGFGQWVGEFVATSGLVLIALTSPSIRVASWRVPAWIAGAYWFTSSTSFANPAITVARALSDSFSGIRPQDVPGFVAAQLAGAVAGLLMVRLLAVNRPAQPARVVDP